MILSGLAVILGVIMVGFGRLRADALSAQYADASDKDDIPGFQIKQAVYAFMSCLGLVVIAAAVVRIG